MTKSEKELYDGSLLVVAEKWDFPITTTGQKKNAERVRVLISKNMQPKSFVETMNAVEGGSAIYKIDEEATLDFLKKKHNVKPTKTKDETNS